MVLELQKDERGPVRWECAWEIEVGVGVGEPLK